MQPIDAVVLVLVAEGLGWQAFIFTHLLALLVGVLVTIAGASYAHRQERASKQRDEQKELRFKIYMKLIELNGAYFWIASADSRRQDRKPDRPWSLAWQIADMVRLLDDPEKVERIMRVLFDERLCKTSNQRHSELGKLVDEVGRTENPAYAEVVAKIQEGNLPLIVKQTQNNAPGNLVT